jgi:hypothetical protein
MCDPQVRFCERPGGESPRAYSTPVHFACERGRRGIAGGGGWTLLAVGFGPLGAGVAG